MYKYFRIVLVLTLMPFMLKSQETKNENPVLLEVAGEKITKNEFLRTYFKNTPKNAQVINKADLDNYLDLYINFRLKVKQAKDLKLDTVAGFVKEYEKYRSQLAEPYLFDREVNDELVKEAYERMKWQIRASHILVKVDAFASAQDTLAAYGKIMEIRNKIIKGMSFSHAADEYSEDPSAKDKEASRSSAATKGNHGDLGYFSVFDMIYPFETGAYNTKVGEMSMPVRTPFGYHLIKVVSKTPAMGEIKASHIMISVPTIMSAQDSAYYKNKINFIYKKLQDKEDFAQLAKEYSDDKGSAESGGVLPVFTVNRMVPEFIDALIPLKNGDISEPFLTRFGWHIIQLKEISGIPPFDSVSAGLSVRISKDSRSNKPKEVFVERVKKEYNFVENKDVYKEFYGKIPDSVFFGKWDMLSAKQMNKELFKLSDKSYTQQDFAKYISKNYNQVDLKETVDEFINRSYKNFIHESCINYEKDQLANKYEDFRDLSNEYKDGFLLFDLTELMVWNKAITDTVGLEKFYEENKMNYQWGDRLEAAIFTFEKDKVDEKKVLKFVNTVHKKKLLTTPDKLKVLINKTFPGNDTLKLVRYEHEKYSKKDNRLIDKIQWVEGVTTPYEESTRFSIVAVQKVLPPQIKELTETRGVVIADYQAALEKQWLKDLRTAYPVVIHKEVFESIK